MGWLSDIGNAVSSAVGAVGDAIEGAVNAVTETVRDVVHVVVNTLQGGLSWANNWLCRNAGNLGCRLGNIILGGVSGLLGGAQDLVDKGLDILVDLGGAVGALLRGDLAGFLGKLGDIVLDGVEFGLNFIRFVLLGTFFGGIRDAWQAEDLRRFVENLLQQRFGQDSAQLTRIRERLGLHKGVWGLPLQATHKVFRLDSATAPLWQWHQQGTMDLYAMAGLTSFNSFTINRKRTLVRSTNAAGTIESSLPINRWTLAHYIDSQGKDGRIRVYALTPKAVKDFIQVAIAKFKKLGINLTWNDGGSFEYFVQNDTHDISTLEELTFDRRRLGQYLLDKKLRPGPGQEQCNMLSLAAFKLKKGLGQTSGRHIDEGEKATPCPSTPDRDDSCCSSVDQRTGSGIIYHDQWPTNIFRYVLAHEGGHYVGLCHFGHDGFQHIMFTPAEEAGLSYFDWGLFKFYLDNEPSFTLANAKNTWRFLVAEMVSCLDDAVPANPGLVLT